MIAGSIGHHLVEIVLVPRKQERGVKNMDEKVRGLGHELGKDAGAIAGSVGHRPAEILLVPWKQE